MRYIQANTNGRLHAATEPSVSPLNRGYLYGDAIYEVWRTYRDVVFTWHEHYDRLERSAAALHLTLPWSRADIFREVVRTVEAYRAETGGRGDLYIRLQVSRGAGPIGLDVDLADRAEFALLVQACPVTPPEVMQRGMRLSVARQLRRNPIESLDPAWKTGNYLNNLLALREARARGAEEVLLLNLRGEVTEASTSNIGFVRGGEVITPRMEEGILGGITRALLLGEVASAAGVRVREGVVRPEQFAGMEECFILSTTKEIVPVGRIDDMSFAVGGGTLTARLQAAFAERVGAYVEAHPELRV